MDEANPTTEESRKSEVPEVRPELPDTVRKWLSAIGKKGSKKGRATPPKSLGHWREPEPKTGQEVTPSPEEKRP